VALSCLLRGQLTRVARRTSGFASLGDWDYGANPKGFEAEGSSDPLAGVLAQLDDEKVAKALSLVSPLLTEQRKERLEEVLGQRCGRVQFLFENPANPSNVWACLRSMDAFGVARVHVVVDPRAYGIEEEVPEEQSPAEERARGRLRSMKSSAGSAQWLLLEEHGSVAAALQKLRAANPKLRVLASDLSSGAVDINDMSFEAGEAGSGQQEALVRDDEDILVIMGNEDRGISEEARGLADFRFFLPMRGFAESFNLSVATAITLAYLQAKHGLRPGSLSQADEDRLRLRWYMQSLRQGTAIALFRRHGIELPGLEDAKHLPRQRIMGYRP